MNATEKLTNLEQRMLGALRLALRYLEHPDVRAMPFAVSAEASAARVRAAIGAAEGTDG